MPAHNDTRRWITRTRRSTEAALDGDLWRSLRPLPAAVCTKLLTRIGDAKWRLRIQKLGRLSSVLTYQAEQVADRDQLRNGQNELAEVINFAQTPEQSHEQTGQ